MNIGFLPVEIHKKYLSMFQVRWDDLKIIGNAMENPGNTLRSVSLNALVITCC